MLLEPASIWREWANGRVYKLQIEIDKQIAQNDGQWL